MRVAALLSVIALAACSRKPEPMAHARALYANGDYEDAIRVFKTCLEEKPEHLDAHREYQNAMKKVGRGQEALEQYGAILVRNPKTAWAYYLFARLESGEKLRGGMESALTYDPAFAPALATLALVAFEDRRFEDALGLYDRLFKGRAPQDDELEKFARASFQTGKLEGLDRVLVLRKERATPGEQVLGIPLGAAGPRLAILLAGGGEVPFDVAIQYVIKDRSYRMISAKAGTIRWTKEWSVLQPNKLPEPGAEIAKQDAPATFRALHEKALELLAKIEGD